MCINLVDEDGVEGPICKAYRDTVSACYPGCLSADDDQANQEDAKVRYIGFDFHAQCGKTASKEAAGNLAHFLANLKPHLLRHGLFFAPASASETGPAPEASHQTGVFRINCIDCLDRTNVLGSASGMHAFFEQLGTLGLIPRDELEASLYSLQNGYRVPCHRIEQALKTAWADMGDRISVQYAGTGALKGDFTRSGKRTFAGVLADGFSNVKRALGNNFADVYRQQVLDMVHGAQPGASRKGVMSLLESLEKKQLLIQPGAEAARAEGAASGDEDGEEDEEDEEEKSHGVYESSSSEQDVRSRSEEDDHQHMWF